MDSVSADTPPVGAQDTAALPAALGPARHVASSRAGVWFTRLEVLGIPISSCRGSGRAVQGAVDEPRRGHALWVSLVVRVEVGVLL